MANIIIIFQVDLTAKKNEYKKNENYIKCREKND